jgi:hypothetical protein
MDIVDDLRKEPQDEEWQYKREARIVMSRLLNNAATKIENLQAVIIQILDACEDVNSPDRKVRIEIRNKCRKALKEKV